MSGPSRPDWMQDEQWGSPGGGSGIASLQGDTGPGATDVTALSVVGAGGASTEVTQPEAGSAVVEVTTTNLRPTVQDLLDAGVIATPAWAAETNMRCQGTLTGWYSAAYCKPDTSDNLFAAEDDNLTTTKTGTDEPDWTTAPNVGDTVPDGSYTWRNIGPFSAWPPTPTTWAPDTGYGYMDAIWPTEPFGVVFLPDPGYTPPAGVPDEPNWGDINGNDGYVAQAPGYWLVAVAPSAGGNQAFYEKVGVNLFDAVGQGAASRFYALGPQATNLFYADGQDSNNRLRARGAGSYNEMSADGVGALNKIQALRTGGREVARFMTDDATCKLLVGVTDPSTGGGLTHDGPSLCLVVDSDAGTLALYATSGAGDTDWLLIGPLP